MQDVSNFSFILLNEANRNVLYKVPATQGYVQGALRKKRLIASFVEHLMESQGNNLSIIFSLMSQNLTKDSI